MIGKKSKDMKVAENMKVNMDSLFIHERLKAVMIMYRPEKPLQTVSSEGVM